MGSKSDLLLLNLTKFFEIPENREQLHDIIGRGKGPSLRKLEWFVTNYSKTNHVSFTAPNGKVFTVHVAYKSSLDGYSKKLFDPFCRTERIEFQGLSTTVGQLNFLKWALVNGIIGALRRMDALKGTEEKQIHPETVEDCIHSKTGTNCIQ
jgi:hypothetical protein